LTEILWNNAKDDRGAATGEFRIQRPGKRDITGALWLPAEASSASTLVCFGHGASGNRYQAPISYMASRFVTEGRLPVLSLDGPVHGLRQVGDGGRTAFFPELQRPESLEQMTEEWACAIAEIQQKKIVTANKLAYFGLSMGSIYGLPFVASRTDVTVATLGLLGVQPSFPHHQTLLAAAAKIDIPLLFLMQLEDELFDREGYLKVFDAFKSSDKRIHANPGLHPQVPAHEMDFAFDFMLAHINGID